ncbi:MAG: hypothetical protein WC766_01690 [Patescibacteria group bacterium]|jgi:hypothetical protein
MSDKAKGNITAFAIVLVAMLLLVGMGIGTVVLEGSRRAVETNNAVGAYYMANSGIEMQLFDVRKNNMALANVALASSLYPGGSAWQSTTGYELSSIKNIAYLGEEDLSFVDLFDPDKLNQPAGVKGIKIEWATGGVACQPDVEIGYTEWSVGATIAWPTNAADYTIQIGPYAERAGYLVGPLDTTKAYRLRLRPFKCAAKDIKVTLYDAGNNEIAYPGDITLGSEGTYNKTTQRIKVTMPRQDILSGIFSYIVFSQDELCKRVGGAGVCP